MALPSISELCIKQFTLTLRQRILKAIYPLFLFYKRMNGANKTTIKKNISPPVSFYSLSVQSNDGNELLFENLRNKKVLIVNTASDCGYTNQYSELQNLYQLYKETLVVIAFPSNDFKEQEKGSDEAILNFCQINFGVSFPLAKKSVVIKDAQQNSVYKWLTNKKLNGWNEQAPSWNFSKYLVDEAGRLTHYFDPAVSPLSKEVMKAIHSSIMF